MATLGGIPIKLRLRIEAGIGGALTDVGHADIDFVLPVTITATEAGATVTIDTTALQGILSDAAAAFENALPHVTPISRLDAIGA